MFKTLGILLLAYAGFSYFVDSALPTWALTFGLGFLAIGAVVNQRAN